jgi:hypothetical protein
MCQRCIRWSDKDVHTITAKKAMLLVKFYAPKENRCTLLLMGMIFNKYLNSTAVGFISPLVTCKFYII